MGGLPKPEESGAFWTKPARGKLSLAVLCSISQQSISMSPWSYRINLSRAVIHTELFKEFHYLISSHLKPTGNFSSRERQAETSFEAWPCRWQGSDSGWVTYSPWVSGSASAKWGYKFSHPQGVETSWVSHGWCPWHWAYHMASAQQCSFPSL